MEKRVLDVPREDKMLQAESENDCVVNRNCREEEIFVPMREENTPLVSVPFQHKVSL